MTDKESERNNKLPTEETTIAKTPALHLLPRKVLNKEEYQDILNNLARLFPLCFNAKVLKPLKVGIFNDIVAKIAKGDYRVTKADLRRFLGRYCSSKNYLKALELGGARIDLEGQETTVVTAEQLIVAKNSLVKRSERSSAIRYKKKQETKSQENILIKETAKEI